MLTSSEAKNTRVTQMRFEPTVAMNENIKHDQIALSGSCVIVHAGIILGRNN